MDHPELLDERTLMRWLYCNRRADLEKYLKSHGIPIVYGRGGAVCTTVSAINGKLLSQPVNLGTIEFK